VSARSGREIDASIVIATRDRRDSLAHVLQALESQDTSRSFEVVVVDDGSDPPLTARDLAAGPDRTRLIATGGVGPAAARNRGARAAAAPVIVFTDDDTEPVPGWVEAACEFLEQHPDHVGVEGPVESPEYDPLYEHSLVSDSPGAYWTCNIAYRGDAFRQLGGFLEEFPDPHCEDLDLAYRALRQGPIGFAPEMAITHFPRPMPLRKLMARGRLTGSEMVLFARHRERFGHAARLPAVLFPLSSAVYNWRGQLRRERAGLVRSPRRMLRFTLAALGYLLNVLAGTVTTAVRRRGAS
jgi:glycosyltransferase involved in cell wall biosynthesis